MEPFVFVAEKAVPELGIQAGEVVVVEPGADRPVTVERALPPNYGLLLLAVENGALRHLTSHQPLDVLRVAVGQNPPPSFVGRRRRRVRRLILLP